MVDVVKALVAGVVVVLVAGGEEESTGRMLNVINATRKDIFAMNAQVGRKMMLTMLKLVKSCSWLNTIPTQVLKMRYGF
jgi:hypothetical protein